MVLQIENAETLQMIRDLAQRTGESAETAVETSVRERLARLRTPAEETARRARIDALVESLQARFKEHPDAWVDHGELLYGEDGLPR